MILGNPEYLPLLWLVPGLILIGALAQRVRRRRLAAWADQHLWTRLAPARSSWLRAARYALALVALTFALAAAIRPQVGASLVQVERQGIEVIAVLDVSLSMEATDVVPNRLERSKQELRELFDGLRGDRMGVVLFAGSSFLLCPLTLDLAAANLFLDAVSIDVLPDPGTNLEAALKGARDAFDADGGEGARAIILFTDGEGHEGDPLGVAKELADVGIPVLTVGVGTPSGEPIPVIGTGGRHTGYKKDRAGNVVLSRLDEAILKEVASISGGRYYPATLQGHEVGDMLDYLRRFERGELGGTIRRRVDERFQIPAGIATVFLFLLFLVPEGRRVEQDDVWYDATPNPKETA